MMAAESMLSLRASTASLRKSQWSLKGERSEVTSCIYLQVCHSPIIPSSSVEPCNKE